MSSTDECNCDQALALKARVAELEGDNNWLRGLNSELTSDYNLMTRELNKRADAAEARVAVLESHRNSFSCECGITYYGVECTPEDRAVLDAMAGVEQQWLDDTVNEIYDPIQVGDISARRAAKADLARRAAAGKDGKPVVDLMGELKKSLGLCNTTLKDGE